MRAQFALASALLVCGSFSLGHSQVQASPAWHAVSPVELSTLSPNLVPTPEASKPLRVSGGIVAGQILTKAIPVFPPKTNCLRVNGAVVMHAIIGKDGDVKSVEAVYGADVMRQPNVDAVKQWQYRPFQWHGQPVEVETTITTHVHFNTNGC